MADTSTPDQVAVAHSARSCKTAQAAASETQDQRPLCPLPRYGVIVISVPKCGTMLMRNLLLQLPGAKVGRNLFRDMRPGMSVEQWMDCFHVTMEEVPPGGISVCHSNYRPQRVELFDRYPHRRIFIVRDPRDFIVSYIDYVIDPESRHPHHRLFAEHLKTDSERIEAMIRGFSGTPGVPVLPGVRDYFSAYLNWLADRDTHVVRFEELIDPDRRLRAMARVARHLGYRISDDRLAWLANNGMDPSRSRSFKVGRCGRWRERLTDEHVKLYEELTGDLDARLGYLR